MGRCQQRPWQPFREYSCSATGPRFSSAIHMVRDKDAVFGHCSVVGRTSGGCTRIRLTWTCGLRVLPEDHWSICVGFLACSTSLEYVGQGLVLLGRAKTNLASGINSHKLLWLWIHRSLIVGTLAPTVVLCGLAADTHWLWLAWVSDYHH